MPDSGRSPSRAFMRRFICRMNVENYRNDLRFATSADTRKLLGKLLEQSELELKYLERVWLITCPNLNIPDHIGIAIEERLDRIVDDFRADLGSLQLLDAETQSLRLLCHNNFARHEVDHFAVVRCDAETVCGLALRAGKPVIIEEVARSSLPEAFKTWAAAAGLVSIHCMPILAPDGRINGVSSTYYKTRQDAGRGEALTNDSYTKDVGHLLSRIAGSD